MSGGNEGEVILSMASELINKLERAGVDGETLRKAKQSAGR